MFVLDDGHEVDARFLMSPSGDKVLQEQGLQDRKTGTTPCR